MNKGFTLIELLLAMVITLSVAVAAFSVIQLLATDVEDRSGTRGQDEEIVSAILATLRNDMEFCLFTNSENALFEGSIEPQPGFSFVMSRSPSFGTGLLAPVQVEYSVQSSGPGQPSFLARREHEVATGRMDAESESLSIFPVRLRLCRFRFLKDEEWHEEWSGTESGMPQAVEILFELAGDEGSEAATGRTTPRQVVAMIALPKYQSARRAPAEGASAEQTTDKPEAPGNAEEGPNDETKP